MNSQSSDDVRGRFPRISSPAVDRSRSPLNTLLAKWAKTMLIRESVNDVLRAGFEFNLPKFFIFRTVCDVLEVDGRVMEAVACFRRMDDVLAGDTSSVERAQWQLGFQQRCADRLRKLGDAAMDSENYTEAVGHFSEMLSLDIADRISVLARRSKARTLMDSLEEALMDADEAIKIDPSCYQGYETRYTALHAAKRYAEAVEAFEEMLSKIEASSNLDLLNIRRRYVDPRPTIRRIVDQTVRPMPRILIDTDNGRLYDKQQQADAFMKLPIYNELVSSMTMEQDHARIREAVKKFYQYVMLSHVWEENEPLFQVVKNISVYDPGSNIKLQSFCSLARTLGFRWAWTDSSCIDKANLAVLQESLASIFIWFRGSALMLVHLRGVLSETQRRGDLARSVWNTRAWTLQEYMAAEIVQFYTEDWEPYLGLALHNHKESPDIIAEMEATGISPRTLAILRPGLDNVREKLYLASTRQATLIEDIAYSLFGIFDVAIPVAYGEGERALGRFLEHIIFRSGDVVILAWTGSAGSYNSCLPRDLAVYDSRVSQYVPRPVEEVEMKRNIVELQSSLLDLSLVVNLYERLDQLPSPNFVGGRLTLPGIVFPIHALVDAQESDSATNETGLHVYRAETTMLGAVEFETADDLTGIDGLFLVHPWIKPLLDEKSASTGTRLDDVTHALRLLVRLRQPFGALLFAPLARASYRRVAPDHLFTVQIRDDVSLAELMDGVRTIDVQ